jgi:hypothetical protein
MSESTDNTTRNAEADFPAVMRYVTERATAEGLEEEVMAALYDVLDGAASRAER